MKTSRNRLIVGQSTQSQFTRNSEATTTFTGGTQQRASQINNMERFKKHQARGIVEGNMTHTHWQSKNRVIITQGSEARSSLSREESFNRQSNGSITNIARFQSPKKDNQNRSNDSLGYNSGPGGNTKHRKQESNTSLVNYKRTRENRD